MTEQTLSMKWKRLKLVQRSEFDTNRTAVTVKNCSVAELAYASSCLGDEDNEIK